MMTWSWRLERAYWATEIPVLVRRGWWLLALIVMLIALLLTEYRVKAVRD